MNFLRLLPVFISFMLLGAHFLRAGQTVIAYALLFLLLLLIIRKFWVPWVMQMILILGAAEWLRTLMSVAQMRIDFGMPWTRMAIILGAVALFTALASLVFGNKMLRERYSGDNNILPD